MRSALETDVGRGEYQPHSRVTFGAYAETWIDSYTGRTSRGFRDETRDEYRTRLARDAKPFLGKMPLFHTLRHTCATTLFRRGLNAKQAQLWLGHSSPSFTIATYVHLLPDDLPQVDVVATGGNQVGTRPAETGRNQTEGVNAESA
jgi:integrase